MIKKQSSLLQLNKDEHKYKITATLLNSWQYIWDCTKNIGDNDDSDVCYDEKCDDAQKVAIESFKKVLRREPIEDTEAMARGREYEASVYRGEDDIFSPIVKGGAYQVALSKDIVVQGLHIYLYGILDALKAGHIYDIKRVQRYTPTKYDTSHQHEMYFALVPYNGYNSEFTYLVKDGNDYEDTKQTVSRVDFEKTHHHEKTYYREDCEDIEVVIAQFLNWLKANDLYGTYLNYWVVKK